MQLISVLLGICAEKPDTSVQGAISIMMISHAAHLCIIGHLCRETWQCSSSVYYWASVQRNLAKRYNYCMRDTIVHGAMLIIYRSHESPSILLVFCVEQSCRSYNYHMRASHVVVEAFLRFLCKDYELHPHQCTFSHIHNVDLSWRYFTHYWASVQRIQAAATTNTCEAYMW